LKGAVLIAAAVSETGSLRVSTPHRPDLKMTEHDPGLMFPSLINHRDGRIDDLGHTAGERSFRTASSPVPTD
jgi:hypothetical protein